MRIGQKCALCGTPMRPHHTKVVDWPGTRMHNGGGVCCICYKAGRPVLERRRKRPAECEQCGVPLRPWHVRLEDAPGTQKYSGGGICHTCYCANRAGRVRVLETLPPIRPCRGCGRDTRPIKTPPGDAPGTIRRESKGFCYRCLHDGTAAPILAMAANVAAWRTRLKTT